MIFGFKNISILDFLRFGSCFSLVSYVEVPRLIFFNKAKLNADVTLEYLKQLKTLPNRYPCFSFARIKKNYTVIAFKKKNGNSTSKPLSNV